MEFHGSYGGQWHKNKSVHNKKESKKQSHQRHDFDSLSENESELRHFADHKVV